LSNKLFFQNPCCPNFFVGKDHQDYVRYRLFVVNVLPGLKFLDSTKVTGDELAEAKRVGRLMKVAKPAPTKEVERGAEEVEPQQKEKEEEEEEEEEKEEENVLASRGKVSFGVSRYVYYGKQSEGNRFITNDEL
jgi:hypothetical protein